MAYRNSNAADDIIVGSGLAAVATAIGLPQSRKVLVLGGSAAASYRYYDGKTVPCDYPGVGGLGNDWHGVIPLRLRPGDGIGSEDFDDFFARFYPEARIDRAHHGNALFVPWRPIRPAVEWEKLRVSRGGNLQFRAELVERIEFDSSRPVATTEGGEFRCERLWIAAGALQTPALLERSFGAGYSRGTASDHAFCYIGHADGLEAPAIGRCRGGMFMPAEWGKRGDALYTIRPARFGFRNLDWGFEQRAVFGLPTGTAIAKISRRLSPGLLVEAVYNRFGLLAEAPRYSAYAQVEVPDAYIFRGSGEEPLQARVDTIRQHCDRARLEHPYPSLQPSLRPDLYIPGIHLHNTVNQRALQANGMDTQHAAIQIVDASTLQAIGAGHHSFRMMVLAHTRARLSTQI